MNTPINDNDEVSNVTKFPMLNRDNIMLLCECGCETFNLIANGTMECAYCDKVVAGDRTDQRWIERMPVPTFDSPMEDTGDFVRNSYVRTAKFARKRIMKTLTHWSDNAVMAMVLGYNTDGSGHLWVDIDTEDQRSWVMRKLESLKEYVSRIPLNEGIRVVEYVPNLEPENVEEQEAQQEVSGESGADEGNTPSEQSGAGSSGDAPSS